MEATSLGFVVAEWFGLGLFGLVCCCVGGFRVCAGPFALASFPQSGQPLLGERAPAAATVPTARLFKAICVYPWCRPCRPSWLGLGWVFVLVLVVLVVECLSLLVAGWRYWVLDLLLQSIGDCLALSWNLPPVTFIGKDLSVSFAWVFCFGSVPVLLLWSFPLQLLETDA